MNHSGLLTIEVMADRIPAPFIFLSSRRFIGPATELPHDENHRRQRSSRETDPC